MIGLKFLGKIIKAIKSASSPSQIAGGFILGMLIGLVSLRSLLSAAVAILIILLNVNVAMAVAGYALFRLIAWGVDPWLHSLGYIILVDLGPLQAAVLYRERWQEKIQRWKVVQVVKGSRLFEWVGRISRIGA